MLIRLLWRPVSFKLHVLPVGESDEIGQSHRDIFNESLTWQLEDLVSGPTVRLRWRYDALSPQTQRAQLVHAQARGHRVVAGTYPVTGGCSHDQADPAQTAGRCADDLSAPKSHGATGGPEDHTGSGWVLNDPPITFSAAAVTNQTPADGSNTQVL